MLNQVQTKADMAEGLERLASSLQGARSFVMIELNDKGAALNIAADLRTVAAALKVDPVENEEHVRTRQRLAEHRAGLERVRELLEQGASANALDKVREVLAR